MGNTFYLGFTLDWSGLVRFGRVSSRPESGRRWIQNQGHWHGHMPCLGRTGSIGGRDSESLLDESTVGRELFFRARKGGFSRTAVPDQCLQGLAGFGAVPGWPPRYGAGREFWPMFMRSGTAVRPDKTEDFSALLAASNSSYADKSGLLRVRRLALRAVVQKPGEGICKVGQLIAF